MENHYASPSKSGFTKTPFAGDQKPLLDERVSLSASIICHVGFPIHVSIGKLTIFISCNLKFLVTQNGKEKNAWFFLYLHKI